MNRGTPALTVASSRTDCVPTITSRNPCSADTTQDAPEHASVNWEAWLQSTLAIVTPSCCNRSSLSGVVPWRTTSFPRSRLPTRPLAMRPPRSPFAPATTMVPSFMIPILEKRQRRSKVAMTPPPLWRCEAPRHGSNSGWREKTAHLKRTGSWFSRAQAEGRSLYDIETYPALREANGCFYSARNRARARADGNSPDEMSGRYGEVVRRTHAPLSFRFLRANRPTALAVVKTFGQPALILKDLSQRMRPNS